MTINLYSAIQNSSISVGDVVYASQNESTKNGIKYYGQNGSFPQKIGKITEIGSDYIKVQEGSSVPPVDDFLMLRLEPLNKVTTRCVVTGGDGGGKKYR